MHNLPANTRRTDTSWCASRDCGHTPRRRLLLALLLLGATGPGHTAQDAGASLLGLDRAVELALTGNPGLAGMQAHAEAMAAIPSQVGALPDPVLRLDVMNLPTDSFALDREPMTQLQVGIEQALPYPGKLDLQQRAATRDAAAATSSTDESRLRLLHDVRIAWWQIHYLDRAIEIVARNRELLRQFVQIAQTRYKVGEGLQQDVLLAQVELTRLLDRDIELQGMRREQAARLNALLGRAPDAVLVVPVQTAEQLPGILAEHELLGRAEAARPLLAQRREEAEAARTRLQLARRDRFPDFRVGASYGLRDGREPDGGARPDFVSLGVAVSLPLYAGRKQDRQVDQRAGELRQQEYALHDAWLGVQAEISAAVAAYRRASEQVQLYRTGILPQARQSVASMLSGYQVNKVDFLNLVRAQITLYDYEIQYWKSFTEAQQALAQLLAAAGTEVTE